MRYFHEARVRLELTNANGANGRWVQSQASQRPSAPPSGSPPAGSLHFVSVFCSHPSTQSSERVIPTLCKPQPTSPSHPHTQNCTVTTVNHSRPQSTAVDHSRPQSTNSSGGGWRNVVLYRCMISAFGGGRMELLVERGGRWQVVVRRTSTI